MYCGGVPILFPSSKRKEKCGDHTSTVFEFQGEEPGNKAKQQLARGMRNIHLSSLEEGLGLRQGYILQTCFFLAVLLKLW